MREIFISLILSYKNLIEEKQMYLKTFDEMKKTSAFFMLKPVNAIYAFIITVCVTIVMAVGWAVFAPMDDVVKAGVLLRPCQTVSSVRCVTSGELSIKNYLNDAFVNEGDLLFALDTSVYKTELEACSKELRKNEEETLINQTLLSVMETSVLPEHNINSDIYIKSAAYINEKKRYEALINDIATKIERESSKPDSLRLPQNIQDLQNQFEQNELAFEAWKSNQKLTVIEYLKQLEISKKSIQNRISELERAVKNSTIYAPISGRINEVIKLNEGDYILAGEELLRIIPQNDDVLKADIYVDSSYIARVKVGNPVKIKFPGLAPSRYGMIETDVSLVPPDVSVLQNGQTVFVVEAEIDNPCLQTKNGQIARLIPGISAEARIVTDRSTVMQMILRKLDFIN